MLEETIERMRPLVDPWPGPKQSEAPHPLPCPWIVASPCLRHTRTCPKNHLEKLTCSCDHLDSHVTEPCAGVCIDFLKILAIRDGDLLILWPLKISIISKLRCLLKKERKESEVVQSCLTLCDPMDCSLPDSSVHGILQPRVLEWVAISFPRGSSWPRDRRTQVSCIAGRRFTVWATREALAF